jgi:TetR/AcrR family transcriptional regulator, transcriptional repressor for nem operon
VSYREVGGLTHGALYSHFGSKDDLAAAAFTQGQSASRKRMTAAIGEAPDLAAIVDCYVSAYHRDNFSTCCPMLASASDAARQSGSFRVSFANAFCDVSGLIRATLDENDTPKPDDVSLVIAASMIGVVAVARALKTPDHQCPMPSSMPHVPCSKTWRPYQAHQQAGARSGRCAQKR